MLFDFKRQRILSMPGTAEQPDVPENEYNEEYDLPDVEVEAELTPSVTEEPVHTPEPSPEPTLEPTPEPTEAPLIEIEDEETPLSGGLGMDDVLSDVLEGASYIGTIYNESLYVEVRPLSDFCKEDHDLGVGVVMMILGGTLLLSATIAMIGASMVRRAREKEADKWR